MKRLLAIALLAWTPSVLAQWLELSFVDPGLDWRTLETANFAVHFAGRHRAQARAVAGVAESVLPRITGLLRWKPASRIQVVVLDSADFANGLASPIPFNYTMVFLAPPDEGELLQNREWLELVMTHEIFHIVHLDMARRAPAVLRRIFGRVPFFFPNALQPGWIVEGLAVHAESDPARGYGRLGHAHFEGMMRAEAARGLRPLPEINAGGRGFPLNRDYLYGGYFFAFLEERYGARAIGDFIENTSDNVVPFRVHSNPVVVTRKNMDQLWAEYDAWLRARFAARESADEGRILERAWSLTSPALAPDGARWYVRSDGYTRPQLVRHAPGGSAEAVRGVEQDARVFASPEGSVLLAQPEICGNYNYYYDLNRVAADGSLKRLTRCGRFRSAAPLEDRIVALRVEGGAAEVVLLEQGRVLYRAAPGESLTGVAAKGTSVVVTSLRDGRWSLIGITDGGAQVLLSDQAVKHSPRFGDRDELFFVADYGKVFNVWSLRRDGQLARWTQAAHGVREISAPQDGEMLLTTIEADGDALRVLRLPEAPLEQRNALAPEQPGAGEMPSSAAPDRPYSPWQSLLPRSWLPLLEIADGAVKLGVYTFGQDALALHQYILAPQLELTQQEVLGAVAYIYNNRHALVLDRSMTVKSSSDDEVRSYEIEEGVQWISTWRHLALDRRLYWGLGGALERERLHQVGGATSPVQDERVLGLVAGLDTRRQYLLSEGPSQGLQLRLFAETSHGLHAAFSGDVYRADARLHLPLGRTVVSLRWNEAWGEPDAEPFQLGGNDSDPPTLLPVLNQREFALRGYSSGGPGLTGNRARIGALEWRVPLKDVDRHAMVPPLGLNRLALNVFFDVGSAWARDAEPDYHRGVGIELMSEVRVGYLFGAHLRHGLAEGLDDRGNTPAYLRIGRSF
ncbi:MAG: hypothetical protein ACREU1_00495 [Burkholderiales bacterium]